jgi:L-2,4-diaminobutyric acid acetyltransferase
MSTPYTDTSLRIPMAKDGFLVSQLVQQCPPIDPNSTYCNLLQCTHFANTSVIAEKAGGVVGFISAYFIPDSPDTLFIWQVAVSEKARGNGLALQMIQHIVKRNYVDKIRFITTTITAANHASWSLFHKVATNYDTDLQQQLYFDKDQHFNALHDSEILVTIGPISAL